MSAPISKVTTYLYANTPAAVTLCDDCARSRSGEMPPLGRVLAAAHDGVCALCALRAMLAPISLRRADLLAELADLGDGTDTLGVVIDHALRDDPAVTAEDIRAIWAEATDDARIERALFPPKDREAPR
jgi:hypothetical protein